MSKQQRARELFDLHKGNRNDVITALVREEGMTWAGARTYFQVVAADVHWENYRRKHRWDFLKNPYTYLIIILVLLVVFSR